MFRARVAQPGFRQTIRGGHVDTAAKGARDAQGHIIDQHNHDIRRSVWRVPGSHAVAEAPANGLYATIGSGGVVVKALDGNEIRLGERLTDTIKKAALYSTSNDNKQFPLSLLIQRILAGLRIHRHSERAIEKIRGHFADAAEVGRDAIEGGAGRQGTGCPRLISSDIPA